MFLNIQNINVPFISAYDVFQYNDNIGLTISTTGSYYILQWANDGFNFYPSGFIINVSGSGSWQGSGFAFSPLDYMYDNLASYATGFSTGYFTGGSQVISYNAFNSATYSGFTTLNLDYMYDNLASYQTGLFSISYLQSGNTVSGYTQYFPNNYSGFFNFTAAVKTGNGGNGSPIPFYTVVDTANPNYLWSGQTLDTNPGGGYKFPFIQQFAPNNNVIIYQGPFYAGAGAIPFPWTGGNQVLVGNTVLDEHYQLIGGNANIADNGFIFPPSGFIELTGFGSGVITGDFTLNVIWNWRQNLTPNSTNAWQYTRLDAMGLPITYTIYTGHNIGIDTAHNQTGGANLTLSPTVGVTAGGPPPSAINYGPRYYPTGFLISPAFSYQNNTSLNQDTPLIDFDMISGFAIYLYTSMWSGNTWQQQPNFQISNTLSQQAPGQATYTGMSSGLVTNPYVYFLGKKISGSLVGPNLPLSNLTATGVIALTGGDLGFYDVVQHTGAQTGCFGMTVGTIINEPMPQFSGFGFGIAQYLTLTRSGSFVTLYQSGITFATGFASGAINTTLPFLVGKFNRPTGVFIYSNTGLGLFHLEMWNFCQSQQTIQSNLLTYQAPPQPGLIASTNFVVR